MENFNDRHHFVLHDFFVKYFAWNKAHKNRKITDEKSKQLSKSRNLIHFCTCILKPQKVAALMCREKAQKLSTFRVGHWRVEFNNPKLKVHPDAFFWIPRFFCLENDFMVTQSISRADDFFLSKSTADWTSSSCSCKGSDFMSDLTNTNLFSEIILMAKGLEMYLVKSHTCTHRWTKRSGKSKWTFFFFTNTFLFFNVAWDSGG